MTFRSLRSLSLLVLLLVPSIAQAQATRIMAGSSLPAGCATGNIFYKTGTSNGFYTCESGTWSGPYPKTPAGTGTVTNIATTSPITGGPITTTGTIACATCLVSGGALGTPSSGTATNLTGLPLTTGVTGNLPVTNLNSGTSASNTTFWRGDATWATPAGSGNVTTSATLTANKAIIGNGTSDVTVSAASGVAHLSSGTLTGSNVLLASEVTGSLPAANRGTGSIAQVVTLNTTGVATGSTGIPLDDTIPQNTEGDEYMTLAITPTNSSSTLVITAIGFLSPSSAATVTMALFQDTTANALAATGATMGTAGGTALVTLTHTMAAGTTSATTFKIRASTNSGTLSFNGVGGTRRFGAITKSSIVITEVLP